VTPDRPSAEGPGHEHGHEPHPTDRGLPATVTPENLTERVRGRSRHTERVADGQGGQWGGLGLVHTHYKAWGTADRVVPIGKPQAFGRRSTPGTVPSTSVKP
jgi:hypothetical protein